MRSVFQTGNRLVEVRTESGQILTTQTQPFLLRDRGFQPAPVTAGGVAGGGQATGLLFQDFKTCFVHDGFSMRNVGP